MGDSTDLPGIMQPLQLQVFSMCSLLEPPDPLGLLMYSLPKHALLKINPETKTKANTCQGCEKGQEVILMA